MSLELPADLEWIGIKAFGWSGEDIPLTKDERNVLEDITIGGKVGYVGGNAFGCFRNSAIKVADSNSEYASVDGFLTNKAGDYLMMAPSGLSGSTIIPDGIGGIASGVFRYNENITNVHIPSSVTSISENAFHYSVDDNKNRKYSVTIHGQPGSAAEKFANKYNIAFIAE